MSEQTAVKKEQSMELQKQMIAAHFKRLSKAKEEGKKVVYTFVPGNLNELIWSFGMLPVHPEINALQSGMRKKSGAYVQEAEKFGHSEDVCTYVKCDIGMLKRGNVGPTGEPLPEPDLLLLSYTGCFTFMKWFELLKEEYDCPVAMLHTPYQGDGKITPEMTEYMVRQLRDKVIPLMEQVSGKKFDEDNLRERLASSARAEENLVSVWESAKHKPSPIDAYFGGVYYIGPIFSAFRGLEQAEEYYRTLRAEVDERMRSNLGPITPDGQMTEEKYRLVVEGPPNWTSFREFWKMFYEEGAVVVNSTYVKVGGLYDNGFRHDPERPLETL
ncbi:MAG: benzoyl-CoA reductase subunit B, partial [Chromatiales bacterium]